MVTVNQLLIAATLAASLSSSCDAFLVSRLNPLSRGTSTFSTKSTLTMSDTRKKVVVVGNGMTGQKFMERLRELDEGKVFDISTFCEEPLAAYNRMRLTEYFNNRDPNNLSLVGDYDSEGKSQWFEDNDVNLYLNEKAVTIDCTTKKIVSEKGTEVPYDYAVLATGSNPFVPPTPGKDLKGIFVYRTIEDLENMIAYQKEHGVTRAAVVGGGLLGLEAAKAMYDLGMETHILEYAPILMPRQVDQAGYSILKGKIEEMGLEVHTGARISEYKADASGERVESVMFSEENGWDPLDVGMVVVSAGIRPRDELARSSTIEVHERGGIIVNDELQTSEQDVYSIGECALHRGMIYGLVAPCYKMAEGLAQNLVEMGTGSEKTVFEGADMSTKLKLLGCDVASFGMYDDKKEGTVALVKNDPLAQTYKKLIFSEDGTKLLGGMLVGDASDYTTLLGLSKSTKPLTISPSELMFGSSDGGGGAELGVDAMDDEMQICSCNDVTKGDIMTAIKEGGLETVGAVKTCTKAGTGCGGCEPTVVKLFNHAMAEAGIEVKKDLCEHFPYSRAELYEIVRVKEYKSFDELLAGHGSGCGCEVCKPVAASIFASIYNDPIPADPYTVLQDTNDRSMANMQRGGTYSVVPRVPGGEILPSQLIALGEVAQDYNLYSKVTGAQRIDLFGAYKHELPEIWEKLTAVGLESGHAYAKGLRTVKSCVGTSWCRYGQQDSVGFAIEVENRYKGLRSPHKLKSAVSGCIRECAEAQSKDFGLIATETGYNLYLGGNGGSYPRHADLVATDLDEATAIKYIDRFLMYYVKTADRLERTARWIERIEGGMEHVKDVILKDSLGICDELEAQMQHIVDTYQNEWQTAAANPEMRKRYRQFVNTEENQENIEKITERGQTRPANWPKKIEWVPIKKEVLEQQKEWVTVGKVNDFPKNGGAAILHGETQIAVFHFASKNEWFATQNMCPHMRAPVLAEGMIGDVSGKPKVACPLHKKNFLLESGECVDEPEFNLQTFAVKVEGDNVMVELPPKDILNNVLSTDKLKIKADTCSGNCHSS